MLYKVHYGYNRNKQVIQCDRIRLCRQHILRGEIEQVDEEDQSHAHECSDEAMRPLNNENIKMKCLLGQAQREST